MTWGARNQKRNAGSSQNRTAEGTVRHLEIKIVHVGHSSRLLEVWNKCGVINKTFTKGTEMYFQACCCVSKLFVIIFLHAGQSSSSRSLSLKKNKGRQVKMSQLPGMVMLGRREVTRSPSPIITPVDEPPQLGRPQPYSAQAVVRESLVVFCSFVGASPH